MKPMLYIMVGREIMPMGGVEEYADNLSTDQNRRIAKDEIGGILVSTVFLGVDHGMDRDIPVLFETMLFPGENNWEELEGYTRRYSSIDEAEEGHEEIVESLEKALSENRIPIVVDGEER